MGTAVNYVASGQGTLLPSGYLTTDGGQIVDANGTPVFDGRTMVSSAGKAGTLVLWNDQTWHRGGPNLSQGRIRWVIQTPFARRAIGLRYWPHVNYHMPEAVIARATPRRKRLLGFHPIGAYG